MGLIPQSFEGKIQFVEGHLSDWTTNAVAIGSSAAEITAISTKATAARAAMTDQTTAQATAKSKTAALHTAVDVLMDATSDLIKKVRAKAATDGDGIYQLANIPAPALPTPVNELGTPTDFKVELGGDGALTLKWKCASPRASGVVYQVWRRIGDTGEFTYLGGTGMKQFVDDTLPGGASTIVYRLQAVRSTAAGPWATFTVLFGVSPSGEATAAVTTLKAAA